jgi:hypothetical protein
MRSRRMRMWQMINLFFGYVLSRAANADRTMPTGVYVYVPAFAMCAGWRSRRPC